MKNLIAIAISAGLLVIPHDLLADGHDNFEDEPTAPSASSKRNVSLPDDAPFQRACNASINMRDWENSEVCGCAGQYTSAKPSGGVSAKDLAKNPHWVKQPDAYSYNDMVDLNKSGTMIEFDRATKLADGRWSCRAAFFGYIVGNGDLTLSWRGRFVPENKVNLNGDQSNIARDIDTIRRKLNLDLRKLNLSLEKCSSQDVIDQLAIGLKDLCRMAMLDFETRVAALKNPALGASSSVSSGSSTSDEEVCAKAVNPSDPDRWSKKPEDQSYVKQAQNRGYSSDECHFMVGGSTKRPGSKTLPLEPPKRENSVQSTAPQNQLSDRLKALKKLEDAGLISKEEAAAKRKEILKNL